MITRRKTSSPNHKSEPFKPGTRGLLEPIKSLSKTTNMSRWNLDTWRWLHIYFLM
jgi:hypothetical protein